MSDEERDNDIESDKQIEKSFKDHIVMLSVPADKRAHHNALERKRRDHIKDSFTMLRDALPFFQGDKVRASRAQILKKAADYITTMRRKNVAHQQDIDDLKRQNKTLEEQIRLLEKARTPENIASATLAVENAKQTLKKLGNSRDFHGQDFNDSSDNDNECSEDSSENSRDSNDNPRKRLKTASNSSRM